MIQDDEQLHEAQFELQKLWRFLEAARHQHPAQDYQILATPYLLEIKQKQREIIEYLSTAPQEVAMA